MKKLVVLLLILVMLPSVLSFSLRDYPDFFITENTLNVKLVVGDTAIASDTIGAIEIATSLQYNPTTNESFQGLRAVLASEIDDFTKENIISVGGPCANGVTAEIMGFPASCSEVVEPNAGLIKLFEFENRFSVVVVGYSAMDTRRASRVLANYYDSALPNSKSTKVFFTSKKEILINWCFVNIMFCSCYFEFNFSFSMSR